MKIHGHRLLILIVCVMGACIEPYDPPLEEGSVNYLVVDGFLNISNGSAIVRLTRAVPVKAEGVVPPETGAFVQVEDFAGTSYPLQEVSTGRYEGNIPAASAQPSYRLRIHTADGHQYLSAFERAMTAPPIDSISYGAVNGGIMLYANTHDPSGAATHFRWNYSETFEHHANYNSALMVTDNGIEPRPFDKSINICWNSRESTSIMVASTKHLKGAVVRSFPIRFIPFGSLELTVKYSMLLRQQALTEKAYDYWLNLEKNTEQLGGLFDPLPGELPGNIESVSHPGEKVIGFFSASEVHELRRYVTRGELPVDVLRFFRNPICSLDTLFNEQLEGISTATLLVDAIYPPGSITPIGYFTANPSCIDCRLRGGTLTKPPFWE